MGSYYKEVNFEEITVAYLLSTCSIIFPLLLKKAPDLWKKSHTSNTQAQYTFDVEKIEEIDLLLKEITFPHDHQLASKKELRGKV